MAVREGKVMVNGEVESRIRKKMRSGDTASFNADECIVESSVITNSSAKEE